MKNFKIKLGHVVLALALVFVASASKASAAADFTGCPTLMMGSTATSCVMTLQTGVGAIADGKFGPATKAKVATFQSEHGLTVDGIAGAMTKAAISGSPVVVTGLPAGCTSNTGFSTTTGASCATTGTLPAGCTVGALFSSTTGMSCTSTTTGPLGSGEGDMTTFSEVSSKDSTLEEGKVNELFAFTAEVDGDVLVDRVDFYLDSTAAATQSENAEDYFKNASLWINGTKSTVDVGDFTEDSYGETTGVTGDGDQYRVRFSGLNSVFKDGDKPKFVVAFEANTTIDSGDLSETWGVALVADSVRFVDGKGFSSTAGSAMSETFTGVAEDVAELDISSASTDPVASTIEVSDTDTTKDKTVFVVDIEEMNDVDVTIEDMTVTITTTGTTDESAVIESAEIFNGTTSLGSESVPAGGVVSFENMGLEIGAGETETLTLKLTFADVDGYTEGTTVTAVLTSIDDATDANNNDEGDMTIAGEGVSSETHELRSEGVSIALVDTTAAPTGAVKTFTADAATEDDQGTYTISFAVTAFGADMYIDASSEVGGANAAGQGVEFMERDTAGTPVLSSNLLTSTTNDTDDTANVFQVERGETRTFTLTVIYAADSTPTDGSVEVYLESINWGTATDDTNANYYTFDLGDYKSGYLFLNGIA